MGDVGLRLVVGSERRDWVPEELGRRDIGVPRTPLRNRTLSGVRTPVSRGVVPIVSFLECKYLTYLVI